MPVGLGPRFLVEAGFIVAVAVVAGVERFSTTTIILLVFGAWLIVAAVEVAFSVARRRALKQPVPSQPRVAVVPPPAPEPEPEPEPTPRQELEPEVVSLASRRVGPREWNLWELERIARDRAGDDVVRDEERTYLLMYLREFASPEGVLPADFDGVVRESFGDVLDAAYS